MVKLVQISGKKMCRILEKLEFQAIQAKDSHIRLNILTEEEQLFLFMQMRISERD